MKEKSAVRIMLLLLNLMYTFQASHANLLNELLVYFVGDNFTMKSIKLMMLRISPAKMTKIYV
jgi:hypothetical protein